MEEEAGILPGIAVPRRNVLDTGPLHDRIANMSSLLKAWRGGGIVTLPSPREFAGVAAANPDSGMDSFAAPPLSRKRRSPANSPAGAPSFGSPSASRYALPSADRALSSIRRGTNPIPSPGRVNATVGSFSRVLTENVPLALEIAPAGLPSTSPPTNATGLPVSSQS